MVFLNGRHSIYIKNPNKKKEVTYTPIYNWFNSRSILSYKKRKKKKLDLNVFVVLINQDINLVRINFFLI